MRKIIDDDGIMHDVIEIPKEATNGDVIKALYPNCVVEEDFCGAVITNINNEQYWTRDWWNSSYKAK